MTALALTVALIPDGAWPAWTASRTSCARHGADCRCGKSCRHVPPAAAAAKLGDACHRPAADGLPTSDDLLQIPESPVCVKAAGCSRDMVIQTATKVKFLPGDAVKVIPSAELRKHPVQESPAPRDDQSDIPDPPPRSA